ncbi:MAG: hypothetical protein SchgKO_16220 [Schleiferiaceae bacterium]
MSLALITSSLAVHQAVAQPEPTPDPQISFAREVRSHEYYVDQAGLWWAQTQQNPKDENAWYQYYRACRNAQGTANWSTDFVNEADYLRLGPDIIALMEEEIPGSFTLQFIKGSHQGVSTENSEFILKAYRQNPYFEDLLADVVSYAHASHNPELRREANIKWHDHGDWPDGFLTFGYNQLVSVPKNGILLVSGDNDTYPAWMLQDALGIRTDVKVLNIDFFLNPDYAKAELKDLGMPELELPPIDVNDYEKNWVSVVNHLLENRSPETEIVLSATLSPRWYKNVSKDVKRTGAVFSLTMEKEEAFERNAALVRDKMRWDNFGLPLSEPRGQGRIDQLNQTLLESLGHAYQWETQKGSAEIAETYKSIARDYLYRKHSVEESDKMIKDLF